MPRRFPELWLGERNRLAIQWMRKGGPTPLDACFAPVGARRLAAARVVDRGQAS
jgi:hypothetical protein